MSGCRLNISQRFSSAAVIILTAALLCSCERKQVGYFPLPGDLLFTFSGTSEMSGAISSATAHKAGVAGDPDDSIAGTEGKKDDSPDDFDHVGIFAFVDRKPTVIEATPNKGVVATPLDDFMEESQKNGGGVVVKRLRANWTSGKEASDPKQINVKIDREIDLDECVQRAEDMLGLPYDWSYLPDNGKIYCSELVYESFVDRRGRHIFTACPMNFRDSSGNLPKFWADLFAKLGERVPEGIPGTNPNGLASEKCLTEIYRSR